MRGSLARQPDDLWSGGPNRGPDDPTAILRTGGIVRRAPGGRISQTSLWRGPGRRSTASLRRRLPREVLLRKTLPRQASTGNCRQLLSSVGWSADRNAGRVAAYNVTERVVMAISKQNSTFQSGDDADGPHLHSRQTLLSSFRAGGRESNRIWATKASRKFV